MQFAKCILNFQNFQKDDEGLRSNKEHTVPLADDGSKKSTCKIASIIILQNLNFAKEDVQIQALEVWKRPLLTHIILLTQVLDSPNKAHLHHSSILFHTH